MTAIGTKIGHITLHSNLRGTDERYGGTTYPLRFDHLYPFLGLNPNKHLPKEGVPETMIGNVKVWVVPKTDKPQDAARVWCECPVCSKRLTAGKLHQHIVIHQDGRDQ